MENVRLLSRICHFEVTADVYLATLYEYITESLFRWERGESISTRNIDTARDGRVCCIMQMSYIEIRRSDNFKQVLSSCCTNGVYKQTFPMLFELSTFRNTLKKML